VSPAESVPSGGRFEIVVNIGGVAEAYVRARRIRGALRLEIVLKCRSREEAERVRASLVSEGFKCLPNSSRVLVIYRSYEVKKFLERHALYLSSEVERLYTSKYSISLPIKPAAATRYRMLVESLVHVGFKEVSGRYLQIRLTYSSPERAREAAEALESLGLKPSMEGKRVVLVYRLCDVNFLADNVIDVPEGLRPLLRRESLFGKWIDEHRVSKEPEFWRLVGLVLGDNDGERALNTFCNTNDVLVEYFVDVASRLFGESFVKLSKKRDKRQSRKELRVARILGTAGRILAEYASRAHDLVDDVDEDCFWQLVTGLYESDGSITVRYPSRDYAVPYPDISIRLAAHQSKLAEAISGRLTREGIAASFKIRSSVAELG